MHIDRTMLLFRQDFALNRKEESAGMSDIRKALAGGCELIFDMENRIQIREEIGRGASCIVYHAVRRDSIGLTHAVRIKECFPCQMDVVRRDDGMLVSSEADADAFTAVKERFYHTYIRNVEIKALVRSPSASQAVNRKDRE